MLSPLREANAQLQRDTMSRTVLASLTGAYNHLAALQEPEGRSAELEAAKSVLQRAAEAGLPEPALLADVVAGEDGSFTVPNLADLPQQPFIIGFSGNAAAKKKKEKETWDSLIGRSSIGQQAVAGMTTVYNRWVRPCGNFAEQRNVASLLLTPAELEELNFQDMLRMPTAQPLSTATGAWPWNPSLPVGAARAGHGGAGGLDGLPSGLRTKSKDAKLLLQFIEFKRFGRLKGDHRCVTQNDSAKLPGWYWVRTRKYWPDLSELMLFWLTAPISTAGVERGFSFQTLIDSNARRRALSGTALRDEILAHIYADWLNDALAREF